MNNTNPYASPNVTSAGLSEPLPVRSVVPVPRWRRILGGSLILVSVALFVASMGFLILEIEKVKLSSIGLSQNAQEIWTMILATASLAVAVVGTWFRFRKRAALKWTTIAVIVWLAYGFLAPALLPGTECVCRPNRPSAQPNAATSSGSGATSP